MRVATLVAGALVAVNFVQWSQSQTFGSEPTPPAGAKNGSRREIRIPIQDFSLIDQNGRSFEFKTLKGKTVLISFIYTTCPDICPLTTASMRLAQKNLSPAERGGIFLLSITTDPEVDRPQVLRSYAERYEVNFSNWSFLTGDLQSLAPVWKVFGVKVQRKARGLLNHTSLTVLVDKKGVMRFGYHDKSPDQKIVLRDLRALLREP
jgi:protein SCO1/2